MSKWLYIDNFRGFKDTYIPLSDVNFLVGENSTGKTSILYLLKLLESPEFWFVQSFNTEIVNLGLFGDIASVQTKGKKIFKIGIIVPSKGNGKKLTENFSAILMTFEKKDNNPLIYQYNYIGSLGKAEIIFKGNQILYKYVTIDSLSQSQEAVLRVFKEWTGEEQQDIKEYKSLHKETPFKRQAVLLFIDRLLQQMHGESIDQKDEHIFSVGIPEFDARIVLLAPIRSKPKRTYDEYKIYFNPEGEHTPYLIRKLLKQRKASKDFRHFIEIFGKESGLFESIEIKGYGNNVASPFELRVTLNNLPRTLINVGYGVSQALPVIVEMFVQPKNTKFAIQQPEVHLHPRAQAALGDVIFKLAVEENKQFYIETHSDYTIDRFRLNYRNKKEAVNIKSQILFFWRDSEGNHVVPIKIQENGEYPEDQPKEFREFFIHEEMRLLGL